MTHYDDGTIVSGQEPDPTWLGDVEALSSESCAELHAILEMLTTCYPTIAKSARLIAQAGVSIAGRPRGCRASP